MAHLSARRGYEQLVQRLNRAPQGAAPTKLLYEILVLLFSEREAELVAGLPLRLFTADKAARIWGIGLKEAGEILQGLAGKGLLVDIRINDAMEYVLPPPMAGFFEFSMMRVRNDIDQKLLAELFEQYITVEEDFIKDLCFGGRTQLGRMFVQEAVLSSDQALHVLDFQKATEVIETATDIGIGLCYCRHKRAHQDRACKAPMDICMTFNTAAASLIRHGIVRRVEKDECTELLHQAYEHNLAQFGENVRQGVNFICNCCPCCCEALLAARRFGILSPAHTSGFIPVAAESCTGCGRCLPVCPVGVLSLESAGVNGFGKKQVAVDRELCLGCGVCARNCPRGALSMQRSGSKVITPVNGTHRAVLMAIERGKLQHLLVDNQVLGSHRALAAVLGVILRLPPVKRALASEQIGSRFLGKLCESYEKKWSAE